MGSRRWRWWIVALALALCTVALTAWAGGAGHKRGGRAAQRPTPAQMRQLRLQEIQRFKEIAGQRLADGPRPSYVTIRPMATSLENRPELSSGWSSVLAPPGSAIYDITADPYIATRVFAATASGLYRSTDDGHTWQLIPLQGMYADVGFVKGDPNTLYYGALDGLWKSSDGGNSWGPVDAAQIALQVVAVAVSPADPNRILVGMTDWSSNANQGIWLSTDGGNSFTRLTDFDTPQGPNWANPKALVFAPSDPTVVWAGTFNNAIYTPPYNVTDTPCLFKSADGGQSWTAVPTPGVLDASSASINPADANDIFFQDYYLGRVIRYNTLGLQYGADIWCFGVDPHAFNHLWCSGEGVIWSPGHWSYVGGGVSCSDDGLTFKSVPNVGLTLAVNPAILATVGTIAVTGNGSVLVGTRETAAGLLRWDAISRSWLPSSAGMVQSVNGITVNPANPLEAYASVSGPGLFHTVDGGVNWGLEQPWNPADFPNSPAHYYASQSVTGPILLDPLCVGTTQGTWADLQANGSFTALANPTGGGGHVNALLYEPSSCTNPTMPSLLEARDNGLYRNCGGTDALLTPANTVVNAVWEDPANSNHIVIATSTGLQETTDGGTTWNPKILGWQAVALAVDPSDSIHWLAGLWNASTNNGDLYQSSDGGTTWNPTGINIYVSSILFTPGLSGDIWATSGAATGAAAYHSSNGGSTWTEDLTGNAAECGPGLSGISAATATPGDPWTATLGAGVLRRMAAPPSQPTGLIVSDLGTGSSLDVSWSSNPEANVTGYTVLYALHGQPLGNGIETTGTSATLSGLQSFETYDVAIVARNGAGEVSPRSAIVSQMVTCGSLPLGAPTNVAPSDGATNVSINPTLNWSSVTGASQYRVQVANDPSFGSLILDVEDIPTTQYTVGDTTTGTPVNPYWTPYLHCAIGTNPYNPGAYAYGQYYWRVLPGDSCGYSPSPSQASTLTTIPSNVTANPIVPASAAVGAPVSFLSNATADCGTLGYVWRFGDNVKSNDENPTHTYYMPGAYTWSLDVYVWGFHAFQQSGTLTITGSPPTSVSVISVTPSSGPMAGGTQVTIIGTLFQQGALISIGGIACGYTGYVNSYTLYTTTPAHAPGAVDVTVTNPDTTTATLPKGFLYLAPCPTITLTPSSLPGGSVGTPYSRTVTASGGASPYTYAITSGTLPTGLGLNGGTGAITGTPTSAGSYSVVITATDKNGCSGSQAYTITITGPPPVPVVSAVYPSSGPSNGGTAVAVYGSGFTGTTAVAFGGSQAAFTVQSDGQIAATSPPHVVGPAHVTVTTSAGSSASSSSDLFTYVAGVPVVLGIAPATGPTAGGTSVTVTGAGFTGATAVTFGKTAATSFTVTNDGQITATSPPGAAGTVDVSVTTSLGTSAASAADQFTYSNPLPAVTAVNPTSGPTTGGTTVTIAGSHFAGATAVAFGKVGSSSFAVISDTQITAVSPAQAAGVVDITVTTSYGTSAANKNDQFTYVAPPAPTIASVNPASGPASGGTTLTIMGSHFTGATSVAFGGTSAAQFTVLSDSSLTATSPAHAAGTVDVSVTTPNGTSSPVAADHFTFVAPPTLAAVSPSAGSTAGGTTITLTGTGFQQGASVTLNGFPATSVAVGSATSLTAVTPAQGAGPTAVTVTNPDGQSATLPAAFSYEVPPTITAVRKLQNPFRLKIEGAGFVSGCQLTINDQHYTNFAWKKGGVLVVKKGAALKALLPKGQPVPIVLINPHGIASGPFTFIR